MSQSLSAIYLHTTWSTKERFPFLRDAGLRAHMHEYIGGVSNNLGCTPIIVGGVEDHVHILARFARTTTTADWIKEMKRASSAWVKGIDTSARKFQWQAGYGAFSVSYSNIGRVERYIANQEEHHRKLTFQEEFRQFMRKHGVEWDERYVWD
ncbi:MAG: transposase [Candidatus Hydrogenedentes bacterium]|nr:transposase [Candidatus Hydrogenedentota bacterium]